MKRVHIDDAAVLKAIAEHGPLSVQRIAKFVLGKIDRAPKATMIAAHALVRAGLLETSRGNQGQILYQLPSPRPPPPPFRGPQ